VATLNDLEPFMAVILRHCAAFTVTAELLGQLFTRDFAPIYHYA